MNRNSRAWWAAFALVAVIAGTIAIAGYVGVPRQVRDLFARRISAPTPEEYTVYSAFLDDFVSTGKEPQASSGVILIGDQTLDFKNPGSVLPLEAVALGPEDMAEDFFRQNSRKWPLDENFAPHINAVLSHSAKGSETRPSIMRLSRVGFNWRGTMAIMYFSYRCGFTCGRSGWVGLAKEKGAWHVRQYGVGAIY